MYVYEEMIELPGAGADAEGVGGERAVNVTVVGTGYVGLVTGACFSEFGVRITAADKDADKIAALERAGWSIRAAARELGRDRKQIKRWIALYDVVLPGDDER